jgi:hypothetical protein
VNYEKSMEQRVKAALTGRCNGQWRIHIGFKFFDSGLKKWDVFPSHPAWSVTKIQQNHIGREQNSMNHELVRRKYQHAIVKSKEKR